MPCTNQVLKQKRNGSRIKNRQRTGVVMYFFKGLVGLKVVQYFWEKAYDYNTESNDDNIRSQFVLFCISFGRDVKYSPDGNPPQGSQESK